MRGKMDEEGGWLRGRMGEREDGGEGGWKRGRMERGGWMRGRMDEREDEREDFYG